MVHNSSRRPFPISLRLMEFNIEVTPYWPQANAEVERFNQPLEKIIRSAHIEHKDWRQEVYKFLLNYRATPHAVTGIAPCQLMFGREIRTKLPQLRKPGMTKAFIIARQNDLIKKSQQKAVASEPFSPP